MTVQLVIYRGTHEIGGNCVALWTNSTRIILDCGMPLVDENGESFDAKSMDGKTVPELIENKTIPGVPCLFCDPKDSSPSPDAILLSHAHCDHMGLVKYTRKEIPVYLSPGTSDMMYVGLKFAMQVGVSRKRQKRFTPGEAFKVGDFTITAYPVDHSAFDSMAFLIEAEGKRILYSGDLRLHGRKPGMAEQLVRAASAKPLHAVIMEGTHAGPDQHRGITEQDLEEELVKHMQDAKGIVLANFSPLHVDRLVGFFRASKQTGRIFVPDPYAALVMHKAAKRCKVPDPVKDRTIKVYCNKTFEDAFKKKRLGYVHKMFKPNRITMEAILAEPERFVMVFRPNMVGFDFGGTLPLYARCIYSYWSGYLKQPHWPEFREKLASVQGDFIQAHTSGHIFAEDIVKFVERIDPRKMMTVIPVHTFHPNEFPKLVDRVQNLEDGQVYEIR